MQLQRFYRDNWSSSKVGDLLRTKIKCPRPISLGGIEDWVNWHKQAKETNPFLYDIIENKIDIVQDVIFLPLDVYETLRVYIANAFLSQTHIVNTRLTPGNWHDADEKLIHSMFAVLVDFVEIDKANTNDWCPEIHLTTLSEKFKYWKEGRHPAQGIQYLQWESSLVDDDPDMVEYTKTRADMAKSLINLYSWWKNIRNNRPDVNDISGYDQFCDEVYPDIWDVFTTPITAEQNDRLDQILNNIRWIESAWRQEDANMMKQLVDLQPSLIS